MGEVCLPHYMLGYTPGPTTPQADASAWDTVWDTVNKRVVRILLECVENSLQANPCLLEVTKKIDWIFQKKWQKLNICPFTFHTYLIKIKLIQLIQTIWQIV